jgi:hypothetical protein
MKAWLGRLSLRYKFTLAALVVEAVMLSFLIAQRRPLHHPGAAKTGRESRGGNREDHGSGPACAPDAAG